MRIFIGLPPKDKASIDLQQTHDDIGALSTQEMILIDFGIW